MVDAKALSKKPILVIITMVLQMNNTIVLQGP